MEVPVGSVHDSVDGDPAVAAADRPEASRALTLAALPLNTPALVLEVMPAASLEDEELVLRLIEIGFVPGETVRAIAHGHPGHEPVAVRLGGTTFALRRFEAQYVRVLPLAGARP